MVLICIQNLYSQFSGRVVWTTSCTDKLSVLILVICMCLTNVNYNFYLKQHNFSQRPSSGKGTYPTRLVGKEVSHQPSGNGILFIILQPGQPLTALELKYAQLVLGYTASLQTHGNVLSKIRYYSTCKDQYTDNVEERNHTN